MIKKKVYFVFKMVAAVIFGITIISAYFIKPSAIIPVIAILIIEILNISIKRKNFSFTRLIQIIILSILICGTCFTTYKLTSNALKEQDYIKIQKWRSIPAIHFMSMGVYGNGGYSEKQAVKMAMLPTKNKKPNTRRKCYSSV